MFAVTRPKRPVLRNPWTRKPKQSISTVVLSGVAAVLLATLLGMAWLLLQAFQLPTNTSLRQAPNRLRTQKTSPVTIKQALTLSDGTMPFDVDQVGDTRPQSIAAFRQAFQDRFGPEVAGLLREKALQTFGSPQATARRMLLAQAAGRPFRLAFAGYSITVGRGNFYHQSYPFVLYHLLEPLLQNTLQVSVDVRNAAIGGIPSFPYGFCLPHFLGTDEPDVVSWDYSMNEGGTTAVLEAYIRHAQQAYPSSRPLILALDKNKGRCQLLNDYTKHGLLQDAVCVAKPSEILPKTLFEDETQIAGLQGLQKWNEFGAPKTCPGRGSWHPKKMEHAAIAWTLATYFVDALELAMQQHEDIIGGEVNEEQMEAVVFPPPLSSHLPDNPPAIQSLLFGHGENDKRRMHQVSCRSNFEPSADHENLLTSLVVSGVVPEADAENILDKRSNDMYDRGWVLDVSELERETKLKVNKCGGLGYVDMKMALYGVATSGPLELWLPVEERGHESHGHISHDDAEASHWIDSLVVCEANEKRPDTACKLSEDIQYTVGGVVVELPIPSLHGAAEYLKRPTCVAVAIPEGARLTENAWGAWGLPLQIQAASRITREGGACCLSHLIWEHALHEE